MRTFLAAFLATTEYFLVVILTALTIYTFMNAAEKHSCIESAQLNP